MARPTGTKYIETPIIRPDLEFELPYKKNSDGLYNLLPKHIGGKNSLRKLAASKVDIGYVYLINIVGTTHYKIGVSTNPKKRLRDISSAMPYEINVLSLNQINNPYVLEQELLDEFEDYLIKNEWFSLPLEKVKYIMITLHNRQVKESIYG